LSKIRVMIVDDHLIVREGLRQLLEINNEVEVVAEASNGLECLDLIDGCSPDIIFMDIKMPGINGIQATRLIRQRHADVKVVMLTIYDDDELVIDAIRVGANGYVMKNALLNDLMTAIHSVIKGQAFLDPEVASIVLNQFKNDKLSGRADAETSLTRRELEILEAIVSGLRDRDIAGHLHISEHTVRSHIKSIYRKLNVSSKTQAAAQAIYQGIIHQSNK